MSMADTGESSIISPRIAIGLVLVSIFSMIAYFALSAYAPDFRQGSDPEAHALSKSAIGFAGLRVLLDASQTPNTIFRGNYSEQRPDRSLLVVTPPLGIKDTELKAHALPRTGPAFDGAGSPTGRNMVPGPVLIILPKWFAFPDPGAYGRVLKGGVNDNDDIQRLLVALSKTTKIAHRPKTSVVTPMATAPSFGPIAGPLAKIESLQTISGADWTPLIEAGNGQALLAQLKDTQVYVLADPDLMNTQGIDDLPTAALALGIVRHLRKNDGPVVFDVTLNGLGHTPSLLRAMFSPPFLGATLCAILAALLIGLHGAVRFGSPPPARPVHARGKLALVSNAAELIRMLHREPRMAARYAQTTRNLTIRALGVRRKLDAQESEALFKALEREGGPAYAALLAEANQVSSRPALVALARKLYDWRQGMLHAR